jgi:CRISPR-associated endonuclease Csn1
MAKLKYRLGLDLGANSLGWCVYRLDDEDEPIALHRLGARIFSDGRDPKSLASLAADRRLARQARRRRDRVLKRRHRLIQGLIQFGLMPADAMARKALQAEDPYVLRARGLDAQLSAHELGRALYHLARKRGFKSSRKDRGSNETEKETGKVKSAIAALKSRIAEAECRTVGEYLARQHAERLPVRGRKSTDGQYVLYLQRDMVAEEFDLLWAAQKQYHPGVLTDEARDYLRDTILFQRRLLPVKPGRCLFEADEYRAPLCSPLQQRFRILQELNNLRVRDGIGQRPLTLQERNQMRDALLASSSLGG